VFLAFSADSFGRALFGSAGEDDLLDAFDHLQGELCGRGRRTTDPGAHPGVDRRPQRFNVQDARRGVPPGHRVQGQPVALLVPVDGIPQPLEQVGGSAADVEPRCRLCDFSAMPRVAISPSKSMSSRSGAGWERRAWVSAMPFASVAVTSRSGQPRTRAVEEHWNGESRLRRVLDFQGIMSVRGTRNGQLLGS